MQLRATEVDDYSLVMKSDDTHMRVYANMTFSEGAEIGRATSIFFSSITSLKAFLQSDARPNHRRFADRLIKLNDITHNGIPGTFYGVLVGIAGEVMSPGQGQRANVELALAPAQGFNPGLVRLVVKTRNKVGLAKGAELLLDYGDEFDVTLPLLASGAPVPMLGPMDLYMKRGSPATRDEERRQGEPEAKRQRTEPPGDSGDSGDKVVKMLQQVCAALEDEERQDNADAMLEQVRAALDDEEKPLSSKEEVDTIAEGEVDGSEESQAGPFSNMEKFGEGDRLAICVSKFEV